MTDFSRTTLVVVAIITAIPMFGCTKSTDSHEQAAASSSADNSVDDLRAMKLLRNAIDAHGGYEAVSQLKAGRIELLTLGFPSGGVQDEIRSTEAFFAPRQLRRDSTFGSSTGVSTRLTYIRCGESAWERIGDTPYQETSTLESVRSLYPFQTLAELLEIEESGRVECVGVYEAEGVTGERIRVTMPGRASCDVIIDTSTHLVIQICKRAVNPRSGDVAESVTEFSDYRRHGKLMVPGKQVTRLNGERFTEVSLHSIEFLESLPAELFRPDMSPAP